MNVELKDVLENTFQNRDTKRENEVSEIIKLFQFSNLNLLISSRNGDIAFGTSAFCKLTDYSVKELVKLNIKEILNQNFLASEILQIEKDTECFSAMRILRLRNETVISVNTYNTILREFMNDYIVTILIPSPAM